MKGVALAMKIKYLRSAFLIVTFAFGTGCCFSQDFVNLDFEDATITTAPGFSFYVLESDAIPGWTATPLNGLSGNVYIAYDTVSLDGASVILDDNNSGFHPLPIQGTYSLFFQGLAQYTGVNDGNPLNASISQTGQIPANTQSLTFWGNLSGMEVTINDQQISYNAIGSGANYTVYGANISEFAGQIVTLSFITPPNSEALLDNIQFSPSAVPEPSELMLGALGTLILGFNRWQKSSS